MSRPFSLLAIAIGVFLLCSAVLDLAHFSSHAAPIVTTSPSDSISSSRSSSDLLNVVSAEFPSQEGVISRHLENSYAAPASGPVYDLDRSSDDVDDTNSEEYKISRSLILSRTKQMKPLKFPIVFVTVTKVKTGEAQTFAFAPVEQRQQPPMRQQQRLSSASAADFADYAPRK